MASKWFLLKNEIVVGPLAGEQVQAKLQAGEFAPTDLVWGRGMKGWQTLRWWSQESPKLVDNSLPEATATESWHYALGGLSHGPFNRQDLVSQLKNLENMGDAMLWTKGMKEWSPVYEFHDILTEVGINKRVFPRADLQGKAVIKADGVTLMAPLLTISEGGMGIALEMGLVAGQTVAVEIQSAAFRAPMTVRAEVRYAADGVVGLRFLNLNSENKGAIINFVRQNQTRFNLKAA